MPVTPIAKIATAIISSTIVYPRTAARRVLTLRLRSEQPRWAG